MKLFNILKFNRENELEVKWWHRLTKVLIYGSTILIFLIFFVLFIKQIDESLNPYNPKYVYSFESKYPKTFGFSKKCNFTENNESLKKISIDCGYLEEFLERYSKSISYKEEFLIKTKPLCDSDINQFDFATGDFFCKVYRVDVNYSKLNQAIQEGEFSDIKSKKVIFLVPLLKSFSLLLIIPIFWFVILKSVIYKYLVYIILGKEK